MWGLWLTIRKFPWQQVSASHVSMNGLLTIKYVLLIWRSPNEGWRVALHIDILFGQLESCEFMSSEMASGYEHACVRLWWPLRITMTRRRRRGVEAVACVWGCCESCDNAQPGNSRADRPFGLGVGTSGILLFYFVWTLQLILEVKFHAGSSSDPKFVEKSLGYHIQSVKPLLHSCPALSYEELG